VVVNCNKEFGWGSYKIRIFIDGELIREIKNGDSVSYEIENGKHIIFCEAKNCKRSEAVEIITKSNEIGFSVAFPPVFYSLDYKLTLTKTYETEADTWE
jgi:hypothetical protein